MPGINDVNVLDQFDDLIPHAAQHGEEYLKAVVGGIREHGAPVTPSMREERIGGGFRTQKSMFLVLTPQEKRLKHFETLHFATPMGNSLKVGWYLLGGERAQGIGGWAILGGSTGMEADNVRSLIQFIQESAVVPAMHQVAGLIGVGADNRPKQGFFGT